MAQRPPPPGSPAMPPGEPQPPMSPPTPANPQWSPPVGPPGVGVVAPPSVRDAAKRVGVAVLLMLLMIALAIVLVVAVVLFAQSGSPVVVVPIGGGLVVLFGFARGIRLRRVALSPG